MRRFQAAREVAVQRIAENKLLSTVLLAAFAAVAGAFALIHQRRKAWTVFAQVHRTTRSQRLKQIVEPYLLRNSHLIHQRPVSRPKHPLEQLFGVRILVLKAPAPLEKGVLIVKFSETIRDVVHGLDLNALLQNYHIVLEPSWSGYCDPDLLCYTAFSQPIFVMAAEDDDHRLLKRLGSNLIPMRMGPCDWVDPALSERYIGRPKRYDIVFNSNWKQLKRHYVLFAVLARLAAVRRVALIGGEVGGRTSDDIRNLAKYYRVLDRLTFFERIPFDEVMRVNAESRVAMLLSLKEGSNRSIAEALFCDTPAILLDEHVGGIRKNIVPETGVLAPERQLCSAITSVLADPGRFRPRSWALQNISCYATSQHLNDSIRDVALAGGEQWTRDIAVKANSPEMQIVRPAERRMLAAEQNRLSQYLR